MDKYGACSSEHASTQSAMKILTAVVGMAVILAAVLAKQMIAQEIEATIVFNI